MHPNSKDITGQKFDRLTAIRPTEKRQNGHVVWECLCSCGNKCFVSGDCLRNKHSRSCGCSRCIHGKSQTPIYWIWNGMIRRCECPDNESFKNYGDRGISVSEEFHDFRTWYEHIGPRPGPEYSQDRTDNDGNYERGNICWATRKQQRKNSRPASHGLHRQRWFRAWHKDSMAQYLSNNQREFARKWGLGRRNISNCLHKRQKQHKGWKFEFLRIDK